MVRNKNDVLGKKKSELNSYIAQFQNAVSLVTGTIDHLKEINAGIEGKMQEIDEYQAKIEDYQSELERTKAGLGNTKNKNEKIIQNFNALLEVE